MLFVFFSRDISYQHHDPVPRTMNRSVSTLAFILKGHFAARTGLSGEEPGRHRGTGVLRTVVVILAIALLFNPSLYSPPLAYTHKIEGTGEPFLLGNPPRFKERVYHQ